MIISERRYSFIPDQKCFSSNGFIIAEQGGKYYVDLPRGWTLKNGKEIIDIQKRRRGYYDERAHQLVLTAYFQICKSWPWPWVVKDYRDRIVFVPTIYRVFGMSVSEQCKSQCRCYLTEFYPHYKEINAYW